MKTAVTSHQAAKIIPDDVNQFKAKLGLSFDFNSLINC
jgi:hypothetical protein